MDPFGDLNTELERALGKIVKEKYNTGGSTGQQQDASAQAGEDGGAATVVRQAAATAESEGGTEGMRGAMRRSVHVRVRPP